MTAVPIQDWELVVMSCHLLEDMNIVVGKPPAFTTEITQPCDIRHCFKGPKTALKHINDSDVDDIYIKKLAAKETERCLQCISSEVWRINC